MKRRFVDSDTFLTTRGVFRREFRMCVAGDEQRHAWVGVLTMVFRDGINLDVLARV